MPLTMVLYAPMYAFSCRRQATGVSPASHQRPKMAAPGGSMGVETQMEFAVQMTRESCVDEVKRSLHGRPGVRDVYVSLEDEVVLVRSTLPSAEVKKMLEKTGKLVVFRGHGGVGQEAVAPGHHGAAVAIMSGGGSVKGLARLVQVTPKQCVVEGTVDGLAPHQLHHIKVHTYGDISGGCDSCGDVFGSSQSSSQPPVGNLGSITSDGSGRASFQLVSQQLKVWDTIGRGMLVHSTGTTSTTSSRLMCGIIARSAGLFQNTKKVCTCDGVTIWEEEETRRREDNTRAAAARL